MEENVIIKKVTDSVEHTVDQKTGLTEKVVEKKITLNDKGEEEFSLQTYAMSDGTIEADLTFLGDFHLPTYEECLEKYPMPPYLDSYFHTWGHLPLTYDYLEHFEKQFDEKDELLIFDYEQTLMLKRIEKPVEKYSIALGCGRCHRTIADLLADQKLSHFFFMGSLDRRVSDESLLASLGTRNLEEALIIADRVERGEPQMAKPKAVLGFLCGHCLTAHYTDWASQPFKHNFDWREKRKLEKAKIYVQTTQRINKGESIVDFTDVEIVDNKVVLTQPVKNRIYFNNITEKELKFVKDMGITVRQSNDYHQDDDTRKPFCLYFLA